MWLITSYGIASMHDKMFNNCLAQILAPSKLISGALVTFSSSMYEIKSKMWTILNICIRWACSDTKSSWQGSSSPKQMHIVYSPYFHNFFKFSNISAKHTYPLY